MESFYNFNLYIISSIYITIKYSYFKIFHTYDILLLYSKSVQKLIHIER